MKALVYRMAGLGDSILVYPLLEILVKKGYEVTVWGNTEYFNLAKEAGFCKKTIFYEPKEKFDLNIIFSQNRDILHSNNSIYINPIPGQQLWIVDYYLKKLGFQNETFSKVLTLPFSEIKHDNFCIIHPGSGSKKKNPDLIFFYKLEKILKDYGFETLYLLGPAESELVKNFKNSVYAEHPVEIAKILLKADFYIGLDSGVSHLSSYLGVPSIVIFGPTDPEVWHPIGANLTVIRYESCKPCFPDVCKERKCLETEFLISELCKYIKKLEISKTQIMSMKN
ncbi:MAG: glycosyltransferase family 9 protein [Thermodesulfovibrio sp.]